MSAFWDEFWLFSSWSGKIIIPFSPQDKFTIFRFIVAGWCYFPNIFGVIWFLFLICFQGLSVTPMYIFSSLSAYFTVSCYTVIQAIPIWIMYIICAGDLLVIFLLCIFIICHVLSATVADFYYVSVEYSVESASWWKCSCISKMNIFHTFVSIFLLYGELNQVSLPLFFVLCPVHVSFRNYTIFYSAIFHNLFGFVEDVFIRRILR